MYQSGTSSTMGGGSSSISKSRERSRISASASECRFQRFPSTSSSSETTGCTTAARTLVKSIKFEERLLVKEGKIVVEKEKRFSVLAMVWVGAGAGALVPRWSSTTTRGRLKMRSCSFSLTVSWCIGGGMDDLWSHHGLCIRHPKISVQSFV